MSHCRAFTDVRVCAVEKIQLYTPSERKKKREGEKEESKREEVLRQTEDPFYNLRFITAYDLTMDTRLASSDKRNGIRIGVFHGTLASHVLDRANLFARSFRKYACIRIICSMFRGPSY